MYAPYLSRKYLANQQNILKMKRSQLSSEIKGGEAPQIPSFKYMPTTGSLP